MMKTPIQRMKVEAVVFDVFGTLLRIGARKKPYLQIMKLARDTGRAPRPDDSRTLMTLDLDLAAAVDFLNVAISPSELARLQHDLSEELESVALYPDAIPAIELLRNQGIKVALCSNLAAPYADPARRLLPGLDAYCWSFSVGSIKPEPEIYQEVARQLDCALASIAMIGDTLDADCLGPQRVGMHGYHLSRCGEPGLRGFSNLEDFAKYVVSTGA
jgi:HAD superfamily hydrolase (TIGR01549 family)